jgi:hypothetical protein
MNQEYSANIVLPFFVSLAVVAIAGGAFLTRGFRLTREPHPGQWPASDTGVRDFPFGWPLCVVIVTLVFLAANQLLVRGVAAGKWDADGQFFPYYVLVADHARAGHFVQWDPWSNGGLPSLGDPQVGAFSPVNMVLGLLTGGTSQGFRIYWLLMWWLGGFGMLMLGRHLRAPPWGACIVSLGFLFCGVYTGNAEHTSWIVAYSFLPLIIWRLDVALCSRRLQAAVESGAVWGLSALAGYPGIVIITGCFATLWTFGRWLIPRLQSHFGLDPRRAPSQLTAVFAFSALLLVLFVGGLVLSPTYVAFFIEGAGTSTRVGALAREVALGNSLEPGALATFASPYLTALKAVRQFMPPNVPPGDLWPATDVSMVNIYAGSIIPSFALFAIIRYPRDAWRWWLACLAGLSLACALGETLPLRGWLYDWVYPMRFFRHSAIFRLYYIFSICVLALIATGDLAADLREARVSARARFLIASVGVTSLALLAGRSFVDPAWSTGMPPMAALLGRIHFAAVWLGLCGLAFLLWQVRNRRIEWFVPVLLVGLAASDAIVTSVLSIPTIVGLGEAAERWDRLDAQHSSNLDLTWLGFQRQGSSCGGPLTVRCRRNDQLITKVPALSSYSPDKNVFHLAMLGDSVLGTMATGAQRIWFSRKVAEGPATEGWFEAFRQRVDFLGVPPLVIHPPGELLHPTRLNTGLEVDSIDLAAIAALPAAEPIHADIARYRPQELEFNVHTASAGWLLVTDRWARNWRAEVNGRSTTVYGGNFIFRAVPVSAGQSRVRFTYAPWGFPWLVIVSWATLAAVVSRRLLDRRAARRAPVSGRTLV